MPEGGVRRRWRVGKRQDQTLLTCQCLAVQRLLGTSYCNACTVPGAAGARGFSGASAGQLDVLGHSSVHAPCACCAGTLPGQALGVDVAAVVFYRPGPQARGKAEEGAAPGSAGPLDPSLSSERRARARRPCARMRPRLARHPPSSPGCRPCPSRRTWRTCRPRTALTRCAWAATRAPCAGARPPATHPSNHALAERPARLARLQAARGWSGGALPTCPRLLGTDAPHARGGGKTCQEPGSMSSCLGTHSGPDGLSCETDPSLSRASWLPQHWARMCPGSPAAALLACSPEALPAGGAVPCRQRRPA